ncbi:MAG: tRNA pseudouridine(13) synthase TruD [Candidatus Diapherotrites archaeon]|nr:tRNA pseudouridine(13) synthase TruD [Candidatus Diapherotrites archaeon]
MNFILSPKTFFVSEIFSPKLSEKGRYYYYILEKSGISHSQAVKLIKVKSYFAGMKDKNATTKQWFCTEEKMDNTNVRDTKIETEKTKNDKIENKKAENNNKSINDKESMNEKLPGLSEGDYKIQFVGCSNERIHIGSHRGNKFRVVVELTTEEKKSLKYFYPKKELVCNYFGKQRFDKKNLEIIEFLQKADFKSALQIFLTKITNKDSNRSIAIKNAIEKDWGNWEELIKNEVISGTKKEPIFDFLKNNPKDFLGAFNFVEPKSLRILIKAWQAKRFNSELVLLAIEKKPKNVFGIINETKTPLSASLAFKRKLLIQPNEFELNFRKGLLERKTFFAVNKFKTKTNINEKKDINRNTELEFELGKGEYATIFLEFLNAWLFDKINKDLCSN